MHFVNKSIFAPYLSTQRCEIWRKLSYFNLQLLLQCLRIRSTNNRNISGHLAWFILLYEFPLSSFECKITVFTQLFAVICIYRNCTLFYHSFLSLNVLLSIRCKKILKAKQNKNLLLIAVLCLPWKPKEKTVKLMEKLVLQQHHYKPLAN